MKKDLTPDRIPQLSCARSGAASPPCARAQADREVGRMQYPQGEEFQ